MNTPEISLIIPHIKINNEILFKNIPLIIKNIPYKKIYIITQKDNFEYLTHIQTDKIIVLDEDTVYADLSIETIKKTLQLYKYNDTRAGWYFQQFLKMSWAYHSLCDEWYVVWDSDTFPLKKIDFFSESGKPIFRKTNENNLAYFECLKKLLGFDKQVNFSFIAENMIINKEKMQELITIIETSHKKKFYHAIIEFALKTSRPSSGFSEFETYGNFIYKNYPKMYNIIQNTSFRSGAKNFGLNPNQYDLFYLSRKYTNVSFEKWNTMFLPFIIINKSIAFLYCIFNKKGIKNAHNR